MTPDPSAGEIGGIFAGVVALFVAIGNGMRWWLGWSDRRASTRAAKLDAWQRELTEREREIDRQQAKYWAKVQEELEKMKRVNAALLSGIQLIAAELRAIKPDSEALHHADELLRAAFVPEPLVPDDMTATLKEIP